MISFQLFCKFNHAGWCMSIDATNTLIDNLIKDHDSKLLHWKKEVELLAFPSRYNLGFTEFQVEKRYFI